MYSLKQAGHQCSPENRTDGTYIVKDFKKELPPVAEGQAGLKSEARLETQAAFAAAL